MKYKVYPVIFILVLVGFMSIFGGILDVEADAECPDTHTQVEFGDVKITSNGNQAIVEQSVVLKCIYSYSHDDNCDGTSHCDDEDYSKFHYNDRVSVSVLQNGTLLQTVSTIIVSTDSSDVIKNTLSFPGAGDYVLTYAVVCDSGIISTHDQPITITESLLNGTWDLTRMGISCNETGNGINFYSDKFTGPNTLSVQDVSFTLNLNMAAEFDATSFPCVENSYEVNESGTFTTDGNYATISYVDGGATVSQTLYYSIIFGELSVSYQEAGEDAVSMYFTKRTVLAKK